MIVTWWFTYTETGDFPGYKNHEFILSKNSKPWATSDHPFTHCQAQVLCIILRKQTTCVDSWQQFCGPQSWMRTYPNNNPKSNDNCQSHISLMVVTTNFPKICDPFCQVSHGRLWRHPGSRRWSAPVPTYPQGSGPAAVFNVPGPITVVVDSLDS